MRCSASFRIHCPYRRTSSASPVARGPSSRDSAAPGNTGGRPAHFGGISMSALVISTATGFRSLACASSPSRCTSKGIDPPPQNGSRIAGGLPSKHLAISSGPAGAAPRCRCSPTPQGARSGRTTAASQPPAPARSGTGPGGRTGRQRAAQRAQREPQRSADEPTSGGLAAACRLFGPSLVEQRD